jgi:hypothetical protein
MEWQVVQLSHLLKAAGLLIFNSHGKGIVVQEMSFLDYLSFLQAPNDVRQQIQIDRAKDGHKTCVS